MGSIDAGALAKTVLRWFRDAWLIAGVTLALLVAVELVARAGFALAPKPASAPVLFLDPATQREVTVPRNDPRLRDLLPKVEPSPYVMWRAVPVNNGWATANADGVRTTVQALSRGGGTAAPARIFMFGGSTLWGVLDADGGTIPSRLAARLAAAGRSATVTNLGQVGYVSTQELVALMLRLQRGDVPDVVVFYDGVNEDFTAAETGAAGLTVAPGGSRLGGSAKPAGQQLAIVRLAGIVARYVRHAPQSAARGPAQITNPDALAGQVTGVYLANVDMVRALAARYGFRCVFFWQPTIFDKPNLTPYERSRVRRVAFMRPLVAASEARIRSEIAQLGAASPIHDLTGVFASEAGQRFYDDFSHMNDIGNDDVARAMLPAVLAAMPARSHATAGR